MSGILDVFRSLIDFLVMLVNFPLWLIRNLPVMLEVLNGAVVAMPDFLYPIALLSVSLIVVMAFVKIL